MQLVNKKFKEITQKYKKTFHSRNTSHRHYIPHDTIQYIDIQNRSSIHINVNSRNSQFLKLSGRVNMNENDKGIKDTFNTREHSN